MERFIVAGIQRTGTNFVRTLLNSHPGILCIGEALLGRNYEELGYSRYRNSSWERRVLHYVSRRKQVICYLNQLYDTPGYGAVGFKLMYSQLKKHPEVKKYIFDNHLKIIRVVRRNILKTCVSKKMAKTRGLYHSKTGVSPTRIRLEPGRLMYDLDQISLENEGWNEIINGLDCLTVVYEDLLNDQNGECRKITDFLNSDPAIELSTPFRKVTSDNLEDVLEDYDGVAECLKGTRYEVHLK